MDIWNIGLTLALQLAWPPALTLVNPDLDAPYAYPSGLRGRGGLSHHAACELCAPRRCKLLLPAPLPATPDHPHREEGQGHTVDPHAPTDYM